MTTGLNKATETIAVLVSDHGLACPSGTINWRDLSSQFVIILENHSIIVAAIGVHRELGPGLHGSTYKTFLAYDLGCDAGYVAL
jgi:hypothetical protein